MGSANASSAGASTSETQTFSTEGESTYSVPADTRSLQVTLIGAAGNSVGGNTSAPDGTPGDGAEVQVTIPTPDVSTLYVEVGGTDGTNGGGGSVFAQTAAGRPAFRPARCSTSAASTPRSRAPIPAWWLPAAVAAAESCSAAPVATAGLPTRRACPVAVATARTLEQAELAAPPDPPPFPGPPARRERTA